jgi:Cation transporting ATPase, C-terminus
VAAQAIGQLAITYVPAMNTVFHTAPLELNAWLRILAVAAAVSVVVAIDKLLRRTAGARSRPHTFANTAKPPPSSKPPNLARLCHRQPATTATRTGSLSHELPQVLFRSL